MTMRIEHGDNLITLSNLKSEGKKFDLIEIDGPYMAGLEGWDILTESEYINHYAERLKLARDLLKPWGVIFVFGYPEGCAEIKSWSHKTKTLHCRRWISWYKKITAHKGRKIEVVLLLVHYDNELLAEFKQQLREKRKKMGLTVSSAMALTECRKNLAGKGAGMMWFESDSSTKPTANEYHELKKIFCLPDKFDILLASSSYDGLTNIDFISRSYIEETKTLNSNGLKSKPVQLYIDLFIPTLPPVEDKDALILYGGSGNAGIAAASLGYDVVICESDQLRCKSIANRWENEVGRYKIKLSQGKLFPPPKQQPKPQGLF